MIVLLVAGKILLWVMFALFCGMFAYVLGTLFYLKVSRRKPESIGVSISYPGGFKVPAFIGSGGQNAGLALSETGAGIQVADSWWTVVITLIATACFGPGAVLLYLHSPRTVSPTPPLPFVILGIAIVAGSCLGFVASLYKYFFNWPRLVISGQGIYCLRGNTEVKSVGMETIDHIASRSYRYNLSDGGTVPNHFLYARLREGDDVPLCVTSRLRQIEWLGDRLARLGYKIDLRDV